MAQPSSHNDLDPDLHDLRVSNDAMTGHQPLSDDEVLAALGYRQEFRRKFSIWSIFCLSFSSLGLLSSVAATLSFTLGFESLFLQLKFLGMQEQEA
jgi:hypothetical protein